jgi:hypothetical protein
MRTWPFSFFFFLVMIAGCNHNANKAQDISNDISTEKHDSLTHHEKAGKGALLLTRFKSLEEFKEVISIEYATDYRDSIQSEHGKAEVKLEYRSGGVVVTSILKEGISQADFLKVRNGSLWGKMLLGLQCPYALIHKQELTSIEHLSRRRPPLFGKGDVAFYDLAETMVNQISDEDWLDMSCEDISEKGYLNTFNHIAAQAFMTSIFSEQLADFIADVHELYNMPALIDGNFTESQLADFENGPVDNYLDMINNEWGQELGKELGKKYGIDRHTVWTPQLVRDYLNDIQLYHSWAFDISFKPFRTTDAVVRQFANKINTVLAL